MSSKSRTHDSTELKPLLHCEFSLKLSFIVLSVKHGVSVDDKEFISASLGGVFAIWVCFDAQNLV